MIEWKDESLMFGEAKGMDIESWVEEGERWT